MEHITCHKCKKVGHSYANKCPTGGPEEKKEGETEQVSTHILSQSHYISDDDHTNHVQLTMSSVTLDRASILLDSQSSVHVFNNKELLTDVRMHPAGKTLTVYTNGGHMVSEMVGRFGDIDVWYNPKSIANILSLALIIDKHHVVFNSKTEHAFLLWLDEQNYIKFIKSQRLFVYNSKRNKVFRKKANPEKQGVALIQTVSGNERVYRRRKIESARVAQDVSKLLFHPSQSNLEKIVSGNFISNLPVTLADVRRSAKIYGPSVPSIKGHTTRQTPASVQDLIPIGIPRELYDEYKFVTICLDFFYVKNFLCYTASVGR